MYTVFVVPVRPPAPPVTIRDFSYRGSGDAWRAIGHLKSGDHAYAASGVTFMAIPPILTDCDWIQATPTTPGDAEATFTSDDHIEVYAALDARIVQRPSWLADWRPANLTLRTSDPSAGRFHLFKRRYGPGETVRLGANGALPGGAPAAGYPTIVRAVRPSFVVEAEAMPRDATSVEGFEFTFAVGVGDRYGLDFRFASSAEQPVPVDFAIIASDGREVCRGQLEFPPTAGGWETVGTRTCASINAGTYRLRLSSADLAKLRFDYLEVQ